MKPPAKSGAKAANDAEVRPNAVKSSLQVRRAEGEQGGISEPQDVCVTLKFSKSASVIFPATNSQVEVGNKRRVANVKGAERIVFQRLLRGVLILPLSEFEQPSSMQKYELHPKIHSLSQIAALRLKHFQVYTSAVKHSTFTNLFSSKLFLSVNRDA